MKYVAFSAGSWCCFERLEPTGLDLLSGLLSLDAERRTTTEAALGHEYLSTTMVDLADAFGALNFALG
ncbi:hypothetical protein CsSME_00051235 [Camellia sinensis var. sinensis]